MIFMVLEKKHLVLTARHSTELITTAVMPRAPVPMAISALMPPAILDLLSFLSMQHIRMHPSTYGNTAIFVFIAYEYAKSNVQHGVQNYESVPIQHSIRQRFAITPTTSNSSWGISLVIHIFPFWFCGFGYHQASLLPTEQNVFVFIFIRSVQYSVFSVNYYITWFTEVADINWGH